MKFLNYKCYLGVALLFLLSMIIFSTLSFNPMFGVDAYEFAYMAVANITWALSIIWGIFTLVMAVKEFRGSKKK
jgi:hypothetical protein